MVSIKSLVERRCPVEFSYAGETVHLVYKPLSELVQDHVQATIGATPDHTALRAFLSELLVEWDVLNDDGSPYPMTSEAMKPLPFDFLVAAVGAINDDIRPNLLNASESGAPS